MNRPPTTAIVVSYNTGPRLRDCLYALKSDPEIDGIVVVDNGNQTGDAAWLADSVGAWDKTEAVLVRDNIGFGQACNLGAETAHGEFLIFVNPDAMIRRGSVSHLWHASLHYSQPCLVGGKIFGVDGKEQRGGRRRELTWSTATGLKRWTLEAERPPEGPVEVPVVSGAFFAMTREAFLSLGGFDPRYFLHVEDVDLCRTVRAEGGSVIYQPLAGALHYGSTADAPSAIVAAHKADSLTTYFRKWARGPVDHALNAILLPVLAWQVKRSAR
ncbi:MAG: glycosyltransferase family 2 protein [Pseudomonadota bacterium]